MIQSKVKQTKQYSDNQGEHIVCEGRLILLESIEETNLGKYNNYIYLNKDLTQEAKEKWVTWFKPIVISKTEEVEEGDWVYHTSRMQIFKIHHFEHQMGKLIVPVDELLIELNLPNDEIKVLVSDCVKILSLPEHFSDKHLQAIVDGKIKDGDEVLIKCGLKGDKTFPEPNLSNSYYAVHLDQQNHITLFPVEQSCPECGCTDLNTRHNQRFDGSTAKWEECDNCGEIIDENKQSIEEAYYEYFGQKVEHSTSTHDAYDVVAFAKWLKNNY